MGSDGWLTMKMRQVVEVVPQPSGWYVVLSCGHFKRHASPGAPRVGSRVVCFECKR